MNEAGNTDLDGAGALEADSVNPFPSHSAEADQYGQGVPPELYPAGAPETVEGGENPVPGHDSAEVVAHANDPDVLGFELPVPPPVAGDGSEATAMQPEGPNGGAVQEQNKMDEDEEEDADGDDLFGDGGDDDDDEPMQDQQPAAEAYGGPPSDDDNDGLSAKELAARRRLEYDEEGSDAGGNDENGGQYGAAAAGSGAHHETRDIVTAQVPMANYAVPAGGKVWHARLPNFLQIAVNPYDERTWQPEEDPEAVEEEPSQSQGGEDVKPKKAGGGHGQIPDENVVRWRWTRNELNEVVKQSNARIVRWSDGTLSLQLGSELFDLTLSQDHSALLTSTTSGLPVPPSSISTSSSLTASAFDQSRAHGLTYLTARHGYNGQISEAQASVYGTIAMRPAALSSKTHKKLAGAIASRNLLGKNRGTKKYLVQEDPEKARADREKKEIDKQKKAQREAKKAAGGGRKGGSGGGKRNKKATKIEGLELDSDDDGSDGGYGGRSQPSRRGASRRDYSDDEDEDGFLAKSDDEEEEAEMSDRESIEDADEAIEREARRKKDRSKGKSKKRDSSSEPEEKEEAGAAPRRRLVVESDEDE